MVLSAEKKPKMTKKENPKQPKRLNSSTTPTTKKSVKKELKEKLSYSLINKSSEDFNDSSDFVIPQNRRKAIKNEKSSTEHSNAKSKEPKKRTYQRTQSCSSEEPSPTVGTATRRRTRLSEQKFPEAERNGETIKDNSGLSKSSSALPSVSGSAVKETPATKSMRCSSQESKKPTSHASKVNKIKVEAPEKDEKLKRTPAKKSAKSELVKSNTESVGLKLKNVTVGEVKDKQAKNKQTHKPRRKSSGSSDILKPSEKSSIKADNPDGKKRSDKNAKEQPSRKRTSKSSGEDSMPSKCTPQKNNEKEKDMSEKKDTSPLLPTTMSKKSSPNSQLLTDKKEINNTSSACQSSTVKCPTCKELIPEELLGRHILMCLKKKYQARAKSHLPGFSDHEQLYKDEILARQIHEDMNRETVSSKESAGTEDINFCHLCSKDLTHMNSFWKMKHINQCFDNAEEKNARNKNKVATAARQQIPPCPMCGKQFKTGAMRRCHLKKCAQELSVSPEKALKLIAEQEKNFKESQPATTVTAGPSSASARSLRNKLNKFPDEQMQMAMAMSSSLFDEQEKLNEKLTETVKNIHQGVNRELRKLKRSQKKAPVSTPLLLTVSKEDQLMRNAQRVDSIISEPAHVHFSRQFPHSSLSLGCGDVYHMPKDADNPSKPPSLWSMASLMGTSLAADSFYVQTLMPPIQVNTVIAGSRLKPLSAIPGRGLDKDETVSPPPDKFQGDSPVPSTQTAVLLAELAQLNEEDLDDESSDSTIKQTQGFYLSPETTPTTEKQENQAVSALLEDLCKLINDPQLSDVELLAADGFCVFAHQLLLSVRCPQILNLVVLRENRWVIEMKDVSQNSLLAFLRYLYAGRLDFEKNVTADLLQLSRKFDLPHLASICEKTLQALIDEACYTPSIESVASNVPESLEIDEIHPLQNEDDDKRDDADGGHSGDLLSGISDQPSEECLPLFVVSPLKNSQNNSLHVSRKSSYQESPTHKTFLESSDMECSSKRQNKRKVEILVCEAPTDGSISVIEKACKLVNQMSPSSTDTCTFQNINYKISESTSLESTLEGQAKGSSLDTNAEQIASSLTQQVSVFPEELQDKELIPLVPSEAESERIPTFMSLLSGKCLSERSNNFSPDLPCSSRNPGFTDIPSGTVSQEDKRNSSKSVLAPISDKEKAEKLSKESSGSPTLVSDFGFDDSNELFSEPEDAEEESVKINDPGDNGKKLETKSELIEESLDVSSDSICFDSENQRNLLGTGMSSTALYLADTVCENSIDEDLISRSESFKVLSPANQSQIPNYTLLNGNTTSFHMADTILEASKVIKDTVNSPCATSRSPLSVTRLQESVSKNSKISPKNLHKFSPHSLSGRFDSADRNSRTDFDTDLEVKDLPPELSKSPTFSFSPLNSSQSNSSVKNMVDLLEDSFNALTNSRQRRKRKSCDMELASSPKRSQRKRLNVNDTVCRAAVRSPLGKETSLELSFRNAKSSVTVDNLSDLVSKGSRLPSESMTIPSDLMESPENLLNTSQKKNTEERLEISDDDGDDYHTHCDVELSDSPSSVLGKNLDTFSRLSEDSNIEDTNDQFTRIVMSLEQDSDLEIVSNFKKGKSPDAKLEKNPCCLPGSSSLKTPDRPKKKFTFKRTQLKNLTSPVVYPSVSTVSPTACRSPVKRDLSTPKHTSHLKRLSEDHTQFSDKVESDCEYQPDVWVDFEDNGYVEDFAALSSSSSFPAQQNTSLTEFMSAKKLDCKDSSKSVSPRSPEVYDKTEDNESLNASFIYDFICSSSPIMSQTESSPCLLRDLQPSSCVSLPVADRQLDLEKSKTPLALIRRGRKKKLTVPSPFTPIPTYANMTTPELKKEIKKHGCREMPRKKMLTLLQDIYQRTHQYETDSEMEQSMVQVDVPSEAQPHDPHNVSLQTRSKTQDCFLQSHNEKSSPFALKNPVKKPDFKILKKGKNPAKMDSIPTIAINPESELINFEDDDLLSDTGYAVGAYEESFMANEEDILCSQPQTSSDNLHDRLRTFVKKNPEMYTKMLFYEPVDFDQLKKKASESKIKCSAAKLLGFLDNQCITFAMNKDKPHHRTRKPRGARK